VRSDFGVHIIQVTDIKAASTRSLEEVRDEIARELRTQAASRLYAEQAEQFANMVYEQADSLAPVAEALKLEIRSTDWVSREGGSIGGHSNERLLNALFGDDAVRNARNTEAVEVATNTLVAARVKAYEAAVLLPLDEVKARIVADLRREAAARRAAEQGAAMLAALDKGEQIDAKWGEARVLQRSAPGLPGMAMQAVFSAQSKQLPAHVGLALPEGDYVLYRIESVNRPEIADDDPRVLAVAEQYAQVLAERDFGAFLSELRKRYEVQVKLQPRQ